MSSPLKAIPGAPEHDPHCHGDTGMTRCLASSVARRELGYVIRYITAGIVGNALVLVIYYSFTLRFGWAPGHAFALACAGVMPASFALSRNWAFQSQTPIVRGFFSFSGGYAASFVFQLGLLQLGILLGLPHQFVVPAGQILAVSLFYMLQRFVLFTPA